MAGIYIHIPFCKQACSYCDFHFSTSIAKKSSMVESICREVALQKDYLKGEVVESIYFGGGTPSLLNEYEINSIFNVIYRFHSIAENVEITFEVNPDDIHLKKLKELKSSGINRLSIGVQSFFQEDLILMNRAHDSAKAHKSILESKKAGFSNISIDLIYGSPSTSMQMWERNLNYFFEYDLPHLSSYCLTVESKTKLHHQIQKGQIPPPSDEMAQQQFVMLQQMIQQHSFEQYEVSNFCKNEMYSKHNTSYWKNTAYLGLGPSAHSYNTHSRQWNVANNSLYIQSLLNSKIPSERESLSEKDRFNEYVMTNLRTKWGLDLNYLQVHFDKALVNKLLHAAKQVNIREMCVFTKDRIFLKTADFIYSDKVVRELFVL